jgi:hypothetical protein
MIVPLRKQVQMKDARRPYYNISAQRKERSEGGFGGEGLSEEIVASSEWRGMIAG